MDLDDGWCRITPRRQGIQGLFRSSQGRHGSTGLNNLHEDVVQLLHAIPIAFVVALVAKKERKATARDGMLQVIHLCMAHTHVEAQRRCQGSICVRDMSLHNIFFCDDTFACAKDFRQSLLEKFKGLRCSVAARQDRGNMSAPSGLALCRFDMAN